MPQGRGGTRFSDERLRSTILISTVLIMRLRRIRELLIRTGQPGAETAELLLFGAAEPAPQLRAWAANGEVQLIGLNDLYA